MVFPAEARTQKSVFGLHRRVRIAYPAFRKMHFSATFSIPFFEALRGRSFFQICAILCSFEAPGLAPFGTSCGKKQV